MFIAYLDPGSGSMILQIVAGLALWLTFCWAVASYAKRKGQSFWGFFLLTFFLGLVALIAVLLVRDRRKLGGDAIAGTPTAHESHLVQLARITELRDAGTLTPQEFEREKARIMQLSAK